MRSFSWIRNIAAVAGCLLIAGCGHAISLVPQTPGGSGPGSQDSGMVRALATVNATQALPQLLSLRHNYARLALIHAAGYQITQVKVSGALYPSYGGSVPVTNAQSYTPSGGTVNINMPFSNVPAANNEWVILDVQAVASDGSTFDLGQLAALLNVTSGTTTIVNVSSTTTQHVQVLAALLSVSLLSSYDLTNTPNLDTQLGTQITGTGVTPIASTQLFSVQGLQQIITALTPTYERFLKIMTSPVTPGQFAVVHDYTNAAEANLCTNVTGIKQLIGPSVQSLTLTSPVIAGCDPYQVPLHTSPTGPQQGVPISVDATIFMGSETVQGLRSYVTVSNVYGGPIIVGEWNEPQVPPYDGGYLSVAGRAANLTPTTVTVNVAQLETTVNVNDPAGFAFGANFIGPYFTKMAFPNTNVLADTSFVATSFDNGGTGGFQMPVAIPSPYGPGTAAVVASDWNPWDVQTTNLQMCGGLTCVNLNSPPNPTNLVRAFADYADNLTYFKWTVGGNATAISQGSPGYIIAYNTSGISGTIASTTATTLTANQEIDIVNQASNTGAPAYPDGTIWQVTAVSTTNTTYQNNALQNGGVAVIHMATVPANTSIKSITVLYQLASTPSSPGSYTLGYIGTPGF